MSRKAISSGSPYEERGGYSRAVVDGDWVFVSGTAGYAKGVNDPEDTVAQLRRSLDIISKALAEAGGTLADIISVRVYAARREDVSSITQILAQTFSDPRPTNTTVLVGFPTEEIKVEIEVVARLASRHA